MDVKMFKLLQVGAHEFYSIFRAVKLRVWHQRCEEVARDDPNCPSIWVVLGKHLAASGSDVKEGCRGTDLFESEKLPGADGSSVRQPVAQLPKAARNQVKGSTLIATFVPAP